MQQNSESSCLCQISDAQAHAILDGLAVAMRSYKHHSICRHMYVADLVSMPSQRSKGYGNQIFDYLEETAREAGCKK